MLWLGACAIQDPPPGGPEDRTAPQVSISVPEAGAVDVPSGSSIRLQFSEKMQRTRLERQLTFNPPIVIHRSRWDGDALVIFPETLHPETTYVVELAAGFGDAHGVKSVDPFRFAFATAAAVDSGLVEGRVFFRRKPTEKGIVRLFVLPKDSAFAPEAGRPDRQVHVWPDGTYRFEWLPTNNSRILLWAFHDTNGNGAFDAATEFGERLGDTLRLNPETPVARGARIGIVDPTEPAELKGRIVNATVNDSFPITVSLSELSDTTPLTYLARCGTDGEYLLRPLSGRYVLRAFMDFEADSVCGRYPCPGEGADSNSTCLEPCSLYPDTIPVDPGGSITLDDLILGLADDEK